MSRRHAQGFSLVEVMVALIVTSIGLLGIAKLGSLALSSTGTASTRSLVAIQAAGLASAMHADRAYWAAGLAPATFKVTNGVIGDATLVAALVAAGSDCTSGSLRAQPYCTPAQMAAYDLWIWGNRLNQLLPNYETTITCSNVVAVPVDCSIQVQWMENAVAANSQEATQAATNQANAGAAANMNAAVNALAAVQNPTYILHVEP
jgi:type IV pilus assembly protein PilV